MKQTLLFWTVAAALFFLGGCAHVPYHSLVESAAYNHEDAFNYHLSKKQHDLAEKDHLGQTALMHAACHGNEQFVEELIDAKAPLSTTDKLGQNALHHLFLCHPKETEAVFELFLKAKAPLNSADNEGITPLLLAAKAGNEDIVEEMLDNGANLHLADNKGRTPLMAASAYGREEIVELLLDENADVNARTGDGMTALFYARQFGHRNFAVLGTARLSNSSKRRGRKTAKLRPYPKRLC